MEILFSTNAEEDRLLESQYADPRSYLVGLLQNVIENAKGKVLEVEREKLLTVFTGLSLEKQRELLEKEAS